MLSNVPWRSTDDDRNQQLKRFRVDSPLHWPLSPSSVLFEYTATSGGQALLQLRLSTLDLCIVVLCDLFREVSERFEAFGDEGSLL